MARGLVDHVQWAIETAEQCLSNITPEVLAIEGMSSPKVRHLLNNLCTLPDCRYLEVGVWKGATFAAALCNNKATMQMPVAVDDFSQFDGTEVEFRTSIDETPNCPDYCFVNDYCRKALKILAVANRTSFNLYFYDGGHTYEDQRDAITHAWPILADEFVLIIDDWNWDQVKAGTRDGLNQCEAEVLADWALPADYNGDRDAWWNGLYIAVVRKKVA